MFTKREQAIFIYVYDIGNIVNDAAKKLVVIVSY